MRGQRHAAICAEPLACSASLRVARVNLADASLRSDSPVGANGTNLSGCGQGRSAGERSWPGFDGLRQIPKGIVVRWRPAFSHFGINVDDINVMGFGKGVPHQLGILAKANRRSDGWQIPEPPPNSPCPRPLARPNHCDRLTALPVALIVVGQSRYSPPMRFDLRGGGIALRDNVGVPPHPTAEHCHHHEQRPQREGEPEPAAAGSGYGANHIFATRLQLAGESRTLRPLPREAQAENEPRIAAAMQRK